MTESGGLVDEMLAITNSLQDEIATKNTEIASLKEMVAKLNAEIASMKEMVANLNAEIVQLRNGTVVQNAEVALNGNTAPTERSITIEDSLQSALSEPDCILENARLNEKVHRLTRAFDIQTKDFNTVVIEKNEQLAEAQKTIKRLQVANDERRVLAGENAALLAKVEHLNNVLSEKHKLRYCELCGENTEYCSAGLCTGCLLRAHLEHSKCAERPECDNCTKLEQKIVILSRQCDNLREDVAANGKVIEELTAVLATYAASE